ncbi:hypothetical protein LCGC14_1246140 [marine sediment metagenome]|uniref:Uncharacterized protein n=1 Tax=marine sediment metagenome TaxID=412755 RepID=A0A0F9L4F7_9ZZZZ
MSGPSSGSTVDGLTPNSLIATELSSWYTRHIGQCNLYVDSPALRITCQALPLHPEHKTIVGLIPTTFSSRSRISSCSEVVISFRDLGGEVVDLKIFELDSCLRVSSDLNHLKILIFFQ